MSGRDYKASTAFTEISDPDRDLLTPPCPPDEMVDFWEAFDRYRLRLRVTLRERFATKRLGMSLLGLILPDPVSEEGGVVASLQRAAWLDREPAGYRMHVEAHVAKLVDAGLAWADWTRALRLIRGAFIDRVCDAYAKSPGQRRAALLGMSEVLDDLTAVFGDALMQAPEPAPAPVADVVAAEAASVDETVHLVVDAAPVALLAADESGRIVISNRHLETMFGYARGDLDGELVEVLLDPEARDRHPRQRARYHEMPIARPMAVGKQLVGVRKNGTPIPIEVGLTPFAGAGRKLVLASVFQVTEDHQAGAKLQHTLTELERSNEELEQFAYVASHDLQEPLRMVASYTELLRRRYEGQLDETADTFINYAVEGAQRMSRVVQDLLTYSRVDSRSGSFVPTDTDQLVEHVLSDLSLALEEAEAEVEVIGRLPTIIADPGQLSLVFQNLIGNGLKFARPGVPSRIVLQAERKGDAWQFAFKDNGIGIEARYVDKIFGLFQRLHARSEYEGTGIGLTITRRIVERHGGRIWVTSKPGEGSTFFVSLPLWPVTTS